LNELAPIPLPLAEVIQAYATSELANQIPTIEEENLEPIAITKRSLVSSKPEQMTLL
jgi:hypothetical protein